MRGRIGINRAMNKAILCMNRQTKVSSFGHLRFFFGPEGVMSMCISEIRELSPGHICMLAAAFLAIAHNM